LPLTGPLTTALPPRPWESLVMPEVGKGHHVCRPPGPMECHTLRIYYYFYFYYYFYYFYYYYYYYYYYYNNYDYYYFTTTNIGMSDEVMMLHNQ
jgi:hypothetical protein